VAVARGVDDVGVIVGDDAACDGVEAVVAAAGGVAAREDDA
jgi:hypothetical protein